MTNLILLLVIYFGIFAILAMGQNLITGFAGLLSLGHAGFFAIGAYTMAVSLLAGIPAPLAVLLALALSALAGLLIGLPTLRLSGDYLAIATLGFAEIVDRKSVVEGKSVYEGGGPMS